MALTGPRNTVRREPEFREFTVGAGVTVHQGGIAVLDGGAIQPASTKTGLVPLGICMNSAVAGETVRVRRGCFRFDNSAAADEITAADIGSDAYIVDDETVAKTSGTNTRSIAGRIFDVDGSGVWVEIG